ncbi:hypothetical protein K440DRAFT_660257 [Wilcoxina mikolae CBS 423.85]|nr:hypothetical protein K440DRAFT_660257 [Wilcoxina mikolae CBS 423.85]
MGFEAHLIIQGFCKGPDADIAYEISELIRVLNYAPYKAQLNVAYLDHQPKELDNGALSVIGFVVCSVKALGPIIATLCNFPIKSTVEAICRWQHVADELMRLWSSVCADRNSRQCTYAVSGIYEVYYETVVEAAVGMVSGGIIASVGLRGALSAGAAIASVGVGVVVFAVSSITLYRAEKRRHYYKQVAILIWQTYGAAAGINIYLHLLNCTNFDITAAIEECGQEWGKDLIDVLKLKAGGEMLQKWRSDANVHLREATLLLTLLGGGAIPPHYFPMVSPGQPPRHVKSTKVSVQDDICLYMAVHARIVNLCVCANFTK